MPIEVMMPQMGESIAEGTLVRWLKSVGDKVDRDEPLFEISTDKVDTEIPSPSDGILTEIKVQEGETVSVQTVVALLSGDEAGSAPEAPAKAESAQNQHLQHRPPKPKLLPRLQLHNQRVLRLKRWNLPLLPQP